MSRGYRRLYLPCLVGTLKARNPPSFATALSATRNWASVSAIRKCPCSGHMYLSSTPPCADSAALSPSGPSSTASASSVFLRGLGSRGGVLLLRVGFEETRSAVAPAAWRETFRFSTALSVRFTGADALTFFNGGSSFVGDELGACSTFASLCLALRAAIALIGP